MHPMTHLYNFGVLCLTALSLSAADPAPSPLIILAQETPNASTWVLASLDESVPADIRQNLTLLREDLLDEGKTTPRTSLDAYRSGYQLCNSLITALDERDKALVKAGVSLTQTQVASGGAVQGADARRNYMMSWPQYHREEAQAEERKSQIRDALSVTKDRQKAEWSGRASQLRAGLDAVYATYRDAMRKDPAMVQAMAVPAQASVSQKIGVAPTPSTKQTVVAPPRTSTLPVGPHTNSLGMMFVPVSGTNVLFCIHETRRQDYAVYAADMSDVDDSWENAQKDGVPVGSEHDHPVVNMNYLDAHAFCEWLSKKEGRTYRLPTDREWSYAAGIGPDEKDGETPERLSGQIPNKYPWGGQYPPPKKSGNFADVTAKGKFPGLPAGLMIVGGYSDGYPTTAPVMSFKANRLGLFDLGGNVWEWCDTWFDEAMADRLLRGCSWYISDEPRLLSSSRSRAQPGNRKPDHGFRCVIELP